VSHLVQLWLDTFRACNDSISVFQAQRIELLHRAKILVDKAGDHSTLTKDVSSLLDREIEMLNNTELGSDFLVGLRKRMLNSYAKLMTQNSSSKTNKPKFKVNTRDVSRCEDA
jgi:hypothetical protein